MHIEALYSVIGFMLSKVGLKMKDLPSSIMHFVSDRLIICDDKAAEVLKEPIALFEQKVYNLIHAS